MTWLKKNMGIATIALLTCIGFIAVIANASSDGIHNIGEDAVFISGEACVISMPLEMKSEEAQKKFNHCLTLHEKYQKDAFSSGGSNGGR